MRTLFVLVMGLVISSASPSQAVSTIAVNPITDASIWCCPSVTADNVLSVGTGYTSILKFSRASLPAGITQASIILPFWGDHLTGDVQISGFESPASSIVGGEILAPTTPLGTVPTVAGVGTNVTLDVTSFVLAATEPYLAFRLDSPDKPYQFTSLEVHGLYLPSQLLVTVPEPHAGSLLGAGLLGVGACRRRCRGVRGARIDC